MGGASTAVIKNESIDTQHHRGQTQNDMNTHTMSYEWVLVVEVHPLAFDAGLPDFPFWMMTHQSPA